MEREAISALKNWHDEGYKKPLVLEGARQVGKTYLMREFGRRYFSDVAEFNFDENPRLKQVFLLSKSPEFIIEQLGLIRGRKIIKNKTLIIFDEIQECGEALNSLKYFNEQASEHPIICAGSLLGVYLAKNHAHPVGKVDIVRVAPLSFAEFLAATDPALNEAYQSLSLSTLEINPFHDSFLAAYRNYLVIGGMPESVLTWANTRSIERVTTVLNNLKSLYERDFTKHNGTINPARILMVFRNIAAQLAKENKKFIYGDVAKGARARSFEEAIEWLATSKIIERVYQATNNLLPLSVYKNLSAFKLYMLDPALLRIMAELPPASIILDDDFPFKGALAENFVLSELTKSGVSPFYYTFDRYEIDLLIQSQTGAILPIEVKSGTNLKSPSLTAYNSRYSPPLRIRLSPAPYSKQNELMNVPIYLASMVAKI